MQTFFETWPILREGEWLYDGTCPIRVRLLASSQTMGTGDYEDKDSIAECQALDCVFITYEGAGTPGVFCNLIPDLPSLAEAISEAEVRFPGIVWKTSQNTGGAQ